MVSTVQQTAIGVKYFRFLWRLNYLHNWDLTSVFLWTEGYCIACHWVLTCSGLSSSGCSIWLVTMVSAWLRWLSTVLHFTTAYSIGLCCLVTLAECRNKYLTDKLLMRCVVCSQLFLKPHQDFCDREKMEMEMFYGNEGWLRGQGAQRA